MATLPSLQQFEISEKNILVIRHLVITKFIVGNKNNHLKTSL